MNRSSVRRRSTTVVLVLVVLTVGLAMPASASLADNPSGQAGPDGADPGFIDPGDPIRVEGRGCLTDQSAEDVLDHEEFEAAQNFLPLYRWGDTAAGTLHTRLSDETFADLDAKIARDMVTTTGLSFGNSLQELTARMVEFAINFDLLCYIGAEVDGYAADLGRALMGDAWTRGGSGTSGFSTVLFVIVASLLVLLWRVAVKRGVLPWTALLRLVLVVAVFALMLIGADSSRQVEGDDPDYLGAWSPAWLAVTVNEMVATVASAPATAIAFDDSADFRDGSLGLARDCDFHVGMMRDQYRQAYSTGGGPVTSAQGAVPLVLTSMWEETGLRTWIDVQFGQNNPFGEAMFCHLLERNLGNSFDGETGANTRFLVEPMGNAVTDDGAMVFWAGCEYSPGGWTARESWTQLPDPAAVTEEDRRERLVTVNPEFDPPEDNDNEHANLSTRQLTDELCGVIADLPNYDGSTDERWEVFHATVNWSGGRESVDAFADGQDDVADFMLHLHGHSYGPGVVGAVVYVFASLAMLVVFGLVALGVIAAKMMATVMVLLVFLLLLVAMFGNSGWDRAVKAFKGYLGITIFVFGLQFLLALIALIAGFVNSAASGMLGDGTTLRMVVLGFSPLVAVFVLHVFFTKVLSLPSPFSPTGAMSYAGVVGGVGAAAGAGMATLGNRMGGKAADYGKQVRRRMAGAGGAAAGRGRAGSGRRRDQMDPEQSRHSKTPDGQAKDGRAGQVSGKPVGRREGQMDPTGAHKTARKPDGGELDGTPGSSGSDRVESSGAAAARGEQEAIRSQRDQHKQARQWKRRQLQGDSTQSGLSKRAGMAADHGKAKAGQAWERFKDRPVRTAADAAKTTAKGAGAVGAGATVAAATGAMAPAAAMMAGGYVGWRAWQGRHARRENLTGQYQQQLSAADVPNNPMRPDSSPVGPPTPPREGSLHNQPDRDSPPPQQPPQPDPSSIPLPHDQHRPAATPPRAGRVNLDRQGQVDRYNAFDQPKRETAQITQPDGSVANMPPPPEAPNRPDQQPPS